MRCEEWSCDEVFSAWMAGASDEREIRGKIRVCDLSGYCSIGVVRRIVPFRHAMRIRIDVTAKCSGICIRLTGETVLVIAKKLFGKFDIDATLAGGDLAFPCCMACVH